MHIYREREREIPRCYPAPTENNTPFCVTERCGLHMLHAVYKAFEVHDVYPVPRSLSLRCFLSILLYILENSWEGTLIRRCLA